LLSPRANPNEIMDGAGCRFHVAFLPEYLGDLPKSSAAPTQFIDQFAVWPQTRTRRLLRQAVEDILKLATPWVPPDLVNADFSMARTNPESPKPNRYRTNTEHSPTIEAHARARASLSRRLRDSVSFFLQPAARGTPGRYPLRKPPILIVRVFWRPHRNLHGKFASCDVPSNGSAADISRNLQNGWIGSAVRNYTCRAAEVARLNHYGRIYSIWRLGTRKPAQSRSAVTAGNSISMAVAMQARSPREIPRCRSSAVLAAQSNEKSIIFNLVFWALSENLTERPLLFYATFFTR